MPAKIRSMLLLLHTLGRTCRSITASGMSWLAPYAQQGPRPLPPTVQRCPAPRQLGRQCNIHTGCAQHRHALSSGRGGVARAGKPCTWSLPANAAPYPLAGTGLRAWPRFWPARWGQGPGIWPQLTLCGESCRRIVSAKKIRCSGACVPTNKRSCLEGHTCTFEP